MDELKAMLREVLENQRLERRRVDEIESSVAAIARSLEQDDRLQERLERAEAREREELAKDVDDVKQRVESIGAAMRGLPERTLQVVERKIYELRKERWETQQAGIHRDPTPPYGTQLGPQQGPQPYREQTGKIAVAQPEPEDLALTPAQQRGLVKLAKTAWTVGRWPALSAAVGGTLVGLWHKLAALFGH
jgi:hypothetical protein